MKKMVLFGLLMSAISVFAQPKLSVKKNAPSVKNEMQAVAKSFYDNFSGMKAAIIVETETSTIYQSKLVPAGALECTITKDNSLNTFTWQADMFSSEDFEEASSRYKQYFKQLNKLRINLPGEPALELKGELDIPDEDRKFASTILQLENPTADKFKTFKIEVSMVYSFPEWRVTIFMYQKVADEDVRPSAGQKIR